MNTFQKLFIWDDAQTKNNLRWYYAVSSNEMPAKYLIAKKVAVEFHRNEDQDALWKLHEDATSDFLALWQKIKNNSLELSQLEDANQNLMDLNVELVNRMLKKCNFCKWNCKVDRSIVDSNPKAKTGTCQLGEITRVGAYFHHRGEELIYRGSNGSGTIFFTSCNLRCSFCQNGDISKDKYNGNETTSDELAQISVLLRLEGCHNVNYVGGDPIVHLHTIVRAISKLKFFNFDTKMLRNLFKTKSDKFISYPISKQFGDYKGKFNVPILWNSNFFMSMEAVRILRTIVDIWLPDFKFGNNKCARRLARTPWYFETVAELHKIIYDWGEDFSIRHLIMPNHVECCTKPVLKWIQENTPHALVNIMDQYHPDSFTNPNSPEYNPRYEDLSRFPTQEEIQDSYLYAKELHLNFEAITFENF